MQLAAHEAHDLSELILSCVNTITNMSFFLNQVRDPELRAILERHFPMHVRDYNVKVEYARNAQGPSTVLPVPKLNYNVCTQTQLYTGSYPSATPKMNVNHFDNREIATAYLLLKKIKRLLNSLDIDGNNRKRWNENLIEEYYDPLLIKKNTFLANA